MRNAMACAVVALLAVGSVARAVPLATVEVGTGFSSPTFATGAPGDFNHLFVTERGSGGSASVKMLDLTTHAVTNFLTISGVQAGGEQGLLGMAFDPGYQSNGTFYLRYTAPGGTAGLTTIAAYKTQLVGSPTLVGTVLQFDQPASNHNGGWIGFSPRAGDGNNLYISTGDGGGGYDQGTGHIEPGGNGQSTATRLGKILRINVNPVTATYTVPSGNPFSGSAVQETKEIFVYGLRNPFQNSFDRLTGDFYIADVGQDVREEVNVQKTAGGGENFGWRLREGTIMTGGGVGGSAAGTTGPILDYDHAVGITPPLAGRTVIGGYVYRGTAIPGLQGTYIFGDYLGPVGGRTEIFSLVYDGTTATQVTDLTGMLNPGTPARITNISSFAEDTAGELYVVDITSGKIFAIVPEPATVAVLALGATGLLVRRRRGCQ